MCDSGWTCVYRSTEDDKFNNLLGDVGSIHSIGILGGRLGAAAHLGLTDHNDLLGAALLYLLVLTGVCCINTSGIYSDID